MIIKSDLSKDYDRASWLFFTMMLIHLRFDVHFVNWVMICVSSISFAILINGSMSTFYPLYRVKLGFPIISTIISDYC